MWPFKQKTEDRNYSESIVSYALAMAEGTGNADARLTAAVATAGSLWGRAFAAADIEPDATGLSPDILYQVGLDLVLSGESCWLIEVRDSQVILTRVASWYVQGRDRWRYRLDMNQPDGFVQRNVSADAVFHPRINTPGNQPWRGQSPLTLAGYSAKLLAGIERTMSDEANAPSGYVLPLPLSDSSQTAVDKLVEQLKLARGRTRIVPSATRGWEDARPTSSSGDWQARRLGANPPDSLVKLRDQASQDVLSACGVPPSMMAVGGDAAGSRESFRQFIFSTIQPVSRIIEGEAKAKLHPKVSLSFQGLNAADLQGRARSFKALVDGGMSLTDAAAASGILIDDD